MWLLSKLIWAKGLYLSTESMFSGQKKPSKSKKMCKMEEKIFFRTQISKWQAITKKGKTIKSKITLLILMIISIQGNAQWVELNSGTTNWLRGICFLNNHEGVAVGYNGNILKTANAGETWTEIESNTSKNLLSVFFADNQTGYITGTGGIILKSTDKGNTWTKVREGGGTLHKSYFLTPELGYIAGEGGNILKTEDGGQNWTTLSLGSFNGKVSVFFNNEDEGYFVGIGNKDAIMKTTDGGNSFQGLYTGSNTEFSSIIYTDINTGFACSTTDPTKIIKTTNGGLNWEEQIMNIDQGLYAIKFTDANNGYVVGGFPDASIILKTDDGGKHWVNDNSPSQEPLFDIFMLSDNYGFAVGRNGTILRLGEAVSTDEVEFIEMEIYPNPTKDFLTITATTENSVKMNYSLIDLMGTEINKGNIFQSERINMQDLNSGMYILRLVQDDRMKSIKIMKE